jgi:hypothetical protein
LFQSKWLSKWKRLISFSFSWECFSFDTSSIRNSVSPVTHLFTRSLIQTMSMYWRNRRFTGTSLTVVETKSNFISCTAFVSIPRQD